MLHHAPSHWFAKILTLLCGAAIIALFTVLAAHICKQVFDFDVFQNYVALMMLAIMFTSLSIPALMNLYHKWAAKHNRHAAHYVIHH